MDRSFFRALGPGLLFAGAAVGVSHLVQSTRAGAGYGLGLLVVVLLANIVKYPAFSFGPRYAAATGTSLLEGYRRQGRWALILYGVVTLATMFTVQAAVTVVTAGLAKVTLGLTWEVLTVAEVLTAACVGLLFVGQYRVLDRVIKGVVALLTVSTVAATVMVLPRVDFSTFAVFPSGMDAKQLLFLAALVGWMPSAVDVSVWHSLWTLARRKDSGHKPTLKESMLDFNIGYMGTALLAICFLLLGAGVVHDSGVPIAKGSVAFAAQVVGLYTSTLGEWSKPLIGGCALLVMFSTTLTVVDGFPRALSTLIGRLKGPELELAAAETSSDRAYWGALAVLAFGSLVVIGFMLKSLLSLVDLATTLSFLTAPILSILNHRAITSDVVPVGFRPRRGMEVYSLAGIVIQGSFAVWYLTVRFG
ncbi:MAG: Mn2+/Fe2+ NRAMP family transporter [Myxococcota bacterium]|jgi:Mn2+/Fe2+ NRAMP family transporter